MITIADVAARAGVSKTTVSHALSGKRPVAPETRRRINQVIEELGFHPNLLARGLRMQQTHMTALMIPDITNPFYPVLASGFQHTLRKYGYSVVFYNTDSNLEQEISFITESIHRHVDGVVIASHYDRTRELLPYLEQKIPFVSLGYSINHPAVDTVKIDDQNPMCEAVLYLVKQGRRRIAMLTGPLDQKPTQTRLAGFHCGLDKAGLDKAVMPVVEGDFTRAGGQKAMAELLQRYKHNMQIFPDAICCANDLIAIGAIDVIHKQHLRVPDDIAVIGYDDIDAASLITPSLTTILHPAYEVGRQAAQLLVQRMQNTYAGEGRTIMLPCQLVIRSST